MLVSFLVVPKTKRFYRRSRTIWMRRYIPSNFLNDLANKGGLLREGTLPAGNTSLRVTKGHSAIALVDAVGETLIIPPKLPSVFSRTPVARAAKRKHTSFCYSHG